MHSLGQPIHLLPGEKAECEARLGGLGSPACGKSGGLDLRQREPRVIEKSPACRRQLDTLRATDEKLCADLIFEIADLPAERGLGRMETLLRRRRQASLLRHGDKEL